MKKPFITLTLLLLFSTQALSNDIDVTQLYQKAQSGDAQAQLDLANHYFDGEGVEKNEREAVIWYRKAAEQGHAEAQCDLGDCYSDGLGVEKNDQEAAKWYKMAAEQGYAEAQASLAYCYYDGIGVEKNDQEAIKWLKMAAEQGLTIAQYGLANCYASGIGVEKNEREAVKWFKMAAEQGHVKAQKALFLTNKCEIEIALRKKRDQAIYKVKDTGNIPDIIVTTLGDDTVVKVHAECIKALEEYRDHFVECDNPACKIIASDVIKQTNESISHFRSEKNAASILPWLLKGAMLLLAS